MVQLGKVGVWGVRTVVTPELATAAERLGYGTVWLGGSPGADLTEAERCLDATQRIVIATGIVNIWRADARETAASYHRIERRHPGRFVLGIGSGHAEADPARSRPLHAMREYLDALDAEGVPPERRILAALGPKTLRLAAERSLGAHPYLTPPEHTRWARDILGTGPLLAPEQMVIATDDAATAHEIGRATLHTYLQRVNYLGMLRDSGFTAADVSGGGSDALVDRIVPWGTPATLAAAVRAHLDAGADHVCVQVLPQRGDPVPVLAALAPLLLRD